MPRTSVVSIPTLKMCKHDGCDKIATGYKGFCFAHSPRKSLNGYSSSPRATSQHSVGVEIECYNPESVYKVTHVAACVSADGSLPSGGGEIKLCGAENKIEDKAADVVQRSAIAGNKVNEKCGLHLHYSLPGSTHFYDRESRHRLMSCVQNMQEFMFDIVPRSRKSNFYCTKISDVYNLTSHYGWFSLSSHVPTYEIRIHSGTMNAWKIKGWINAWTQVRPDIHKVIKGEAGWEGIVDSFKQDGFLHKLNPNSIGYKYILARKNSDNGKLARFGFN